MRPLKEVREFAAKQNAGVETFVAADEAEAGMPGVGMSDQDMETGFAQMSRVYNEGGRELYIGAGGREHD